MRRLHQSIYTFLLFSVVCIVSSMSCCPTGDNQQTRPALPDLKVAESEVAAFSDNYQILSVNIQNAHACLSNLHSYQWDAIADIYLCSNPYGKGQRIYLTNYLPSPAQKTEIMRLSANCSSLITKLWSERPYSFQSETQQLNRQAMLIQWQVFNDQLLADLLQLCSDILAHSNDAEIQIAAIQEFLYSKQMPYNTDSFLSEISVYHRLIDTALDFLYEAQQQALALGNWNFSSLGLPAEIKSMPVAIPTISNSPPAIIGADEAKYFICNYSYHDSERYFWIYRWYPHY